MAITRPEVYEQVKSGAITIPKARQEEPDGCLEIQAGAKAPKPVVKPDSNQAQV